jgi:citrate lyase subunit beta/citryl-CoA lyase
VADIDPARTVVRLNASGTPDHRLDLEAIAGLPIRTVMLPKTESAAQIDALPGVDVVALCETPLGILRMPEIAAAERCVALFWGAEDLVAGLGGSSSRRPDGRYRDVARHARASTLISAAAAGKAALDSVYLDIDDLTGLAEEAADAAESGFAGKVSIHPKQIAVVRTAFAPTAEQLRAAEAVVAAAEANPYGVFTLEGRMVDEPIIRQARRLLTRRPASSGPASP